MCKTIIGCRCILTVMLVCGILMPGLFAGDQPQWGEQFTRNMISAEKGLIDDFDLGSGKNIKWTARLGSETWSTPVVASGKVFIGTNNNPPRDENHKGDRGILLCLDETDGSFIWQLVVPKLRPDLHKDWPDHLSDYLLCPTENALNNLKNEKILSK